MTSPDFMYPQPTDDELAAQQPWTPLPAPPTPVPHGQPSDRLGRIAAALEIGAAVLSLVASVVLGATVGPMEARYGYYLSDTPSWFQPVAIGLAGLQVLCALVGVTALIMGIVAIAAGRGRAQGIVASAVAVLAPVVSFGAFLVLSFANA